MIKVENDKIELHGRAEELAAELILLIAYCQSNKRINAELEKIEKALKKDPKNDGIPHFQA